MSIISDALKKVEGNSAPKPPMKRESPQVELVGAPVASATPPLFSVWSIVLSTVMVLVAAVLLLATWYMNRTQHTEPPSVTTAPLSSPVEVAAVPKPPAAATPPVAPVEAPVAEKGAVAAAPASSPTAPADPASKPAAEPESEVSNERDELVLTGVIYTPRVRMAHINGKILPEGARIEGYRIVTISRESVRLSKDEKFYILRLKR